jgi:hypothetical protein
MKKSRFASILELLSILLSIYLIGYNFIHAGKGLTVAKSGLLLLFPSLEEGFLNSLPILFFLLAVYFFSLLLQQAKLPAHQAVSFWVYPLLGLALSNMPLQSLESGIALLLLVFSLFFLFRLHLQQQVQKPLFTASVLISSASLLYTPLLYFLPLPLLSLLWIRPFKLKEHLLVLVTFVLPYFYFYSISYLVDAKVLSFDFAFSPAWDLVFTMSTPQLIGLIFILLLGLLAFFRTTQLSANLVVRERAQLRILFIFYGLAILHFAFTAGHSVALGILILCSAAFYIWLFKQLQKKWLLLLLIILMQLYILLTLLDVFSAFG